MKPYTPLYPPEGAPCRAFVCNSCGRPVRTLMGMFRHLWQSHRIKEQMLLFE